MKYAQIFSLKLEGKRTLEGYLEAEERLVFKIMCRNIV
jgi:hypothetical protein